MAEAERLYCFTLDTEPDDLKGGAGACGFDHFSRLPGFHRLLAAAGARPTYLTTSEVAEDACGRAAMEAVLAEGDCEVGAHFHAWTRQWPFEMPDLAGPSGAPLHAMAHQLGAGVERAMLEFTCDSLRQNLGVEPRSYRGGRWSQGEHTPAALAACGITVDTSVTPGLSWRDRSNPLLDGPDYSAADCMPRELGSGVLELPVGAATWPRSAAGLFKHHPARQAAGWLRRGLGVPLGHAWLRPTFHSLADMKRVMHRLAADEAPVWVFMIHSSELAPCRPLPSEGAVARFVERCRAAVVQAASLGAAPATLSQAAEWVRGRGLAR